ncbi:MAG: hypothetical protein TR69_WS6001000188 [candidate division WS6 bacterium OLB20]|uniref:Uncharacterized protein n=1 Tax=candidate division WS6 bacterium OLB20 TaxID=1617426 RepID=A0A136M092_9BACT|nr:MAG: hypothetical protein TR69_WS6001000188 [candidate division WS6 bacterium OLB20]
MELTTEMLRSNGRLTQETITARQEYAGMVIAEGLREGRNYSVYGLMGGGKTGTLGVVCRLIPDLVMFKLAGAQRGNEQENSIWQRNGAPITGDVRPVKSIADVYQQICSGLVRPGTPISLNEAQFMADSPADLMRMYELAAKNRNGVFADCLVSWFDGQPNENTEAIVHRSDAAFFMAGWDSFTGEPADFTIRLVGIKNGSVIEQHSEDTYYRGMTAVQRMRLANAVDVSVFGSGLRMIDPDGHQIGECTGMPSHHADPRYAIGASRYRTATLENYHRIYEAAEISLPADSIVPASKLFPLANRVDWNSVTID